MQKKTNDSAIARIIKGAVISIGALLPGISGGALCVIMGIYKPMMELLGEITKVISRTAGGVLGKIWPRLKPEGDPFDLFKKYFSFFWPIGVGMVVGALGISKLLGSVLERWETEALFVFIGLILGTLPGLLKEARQEGVSKGSWLALVLALAAMLAWMIPMSLGGQATVTPNFFVWCICGVLWGLGIIVPGMSPSNLFFFLGIATPMYAAIGALDFSVLVPMLVCLVLCILLVSKAVNVCLKKWYSIFMHAVVGVVLASTIVILPPVKLLITPGYTFGMGLVNWLIYALCFGAGCVIAHFFGTHD